MSGIEVEIPKHPEPLLKDESDSRLSRYQLQRKLEEKEGELYALYDFLINNNLIAKYKEYIRAIFCKLRENYPINDTTTEDYEIAIENVNDVLEPYLDQEPRDTFTLDEFEMDMMGIQPVQHMPMKEIREEQKYQNQIEELKIDNENLVNSVRYWCNKIKTCRSALQERGMNLEEFGLEDLPF